MATGTATLGARLKDLRTEKGWTMEELAGKAGVTPEYVSMLEAGLRKPSYSVITELARAFGLTVGSFMSGVS